MKYMQVLRDERSGKHLIVEVIDESSDGLDSDVRTVTYFVHTFVYNLNCLYTPVHL